MLPRKSLKFGRLVFAEADFLPGLIVDRYGDYTVIQIRNPGLFKYKDIILDAIQRELPLKGILIRNDFETLRDASLFRENEILFGEVPKDIITIEENDLKFYVDLWKGQKTGNELKRLRKSPPRRASGDGLASVSGCSILLSTSPWAG